MVRAWVIILFALAILIGTGLVHALWTDRWDTPVDRKTAATRFAQFPAKLGDWEGALTEVSQEQYPEAVYGTGVTVRYVNSVDANAITVYLAFGRPGPLTIHTPALCFDGGGFQMVGNEEPFSTSVGTPARPVEFRSALFSKTMGPVPEHVRVMWSWNTGGQWQAPASPRMALARFRVIYKLYVARRVNNPGDPVKDEATQQFLDQLIPELDKGVLSSN